MALDTVSKRFSTIHLGSPWRGLLPIPDGTIGGGDRQQVMFLSSAILIGGAAATLVDRWADVIGLNTDQRGRITAIIEADRIDAIAAGNRSELLADHGRIE